jgi:hypothetical protein
MENSDVSADKLESLLQQYCHQKTNDGREDAQAILRRDVYSLNDNQLRNLQSHFIEENAKANAEARNSGDTKSHLKIVPNIDFVDDADKIVGATLNFGDCQTYVRLPANR